MPVVLSRIEELVETGLLAPASGEIAEWALRLLERFGAASEAGSEWRIEATTDLPDAEEVWRLLLADAPDLVAELALAAAAVDSLPNILASGPRSPDALLAAMTEHLLHSSPASAASIGLLCDALQEIAANWPRGRPLRILELGAIGGGATRRVLDRLAQSGAALSYVATSADAEQSARLSFLAESFNGVSACQWSPQDGTEALDQTGFDIILAVNACARLQLDANGFADLRKLLAPNGVFVAVEPEPNPLWDMVFGQGPGWWRAGSRASDGSPLRSAEEWCTELAAAGFRSADAASSAWAPWPCAILWGTAPAPPRKLPARILRNRVPSWSSPAMRRSPPWCMIASARLATGSRSLVRQMRLPTDCRIKAAAMRRRRLFSSWPTAPAPVTRPNSPRSKSLHWREWRHRPQTAARSFG